MSEIKKILKKLNEISQEVVDSATVKRKRNVMTTKAKMDRTKADNATEVADIYNTYTDKEIIAGKAHDAVDAINKRYKLLYKDLDNKLINADDKLNNHMYLRKKWLNKKSNSENFSSLQNKSNKLNEFYDVEGLDSIEMSIEDFGIDKNGGHRFELDGVEFYLGEDETLENAVDVCIEEEFFPEWQEQGIESYNVDSVEFDEEAGSGTAYVGLFRDEDIDESLNEGERYLKIEACNGGFIPGTNVEYNAILCLYDGDKLEDSIMFDTENWETDKDIINMAKDYFDNIPDNIKIVDEFNESLKEDTNSKFKEGDLVYYNSASGLRYNCFGKFVDYAPENNQVYIELLCKADGDLDVSNVVGEQELLIANDYAVRPGKDILKKKINHLEANLNNLKKIQGEI